MTNWRNRSLRARRVVQRGLHELRWLAHRDRYKVPAAQRDLYRRIFERTWTTLGHAPDIFNGTDFNNQIKWLMVFDQGPEIVRCSDKLAVREYVREKIGGSYLTRVYRVWDEADAIDLFGLPRSLVLKTNHDSGSVWIIHDRSHVSMEDIRHWATERMARSYGLDKGEWCYQYIRPKVFAEELLDVGLQGIADYKFHCVQGNIIFLQYIYDRPSGTPKEQIVLPDGRLTSFLFDHEFSPGDDFEFPICWDELLKTAEILSKDFKYVRVDLYVHDEQIRFGEMTFFPKNGNYKTAAQAKLGELFRVDRTTRRPPYALAGTVT